MPFLQDEMGDKTRALIVPFNKADVIRAVTESRLPLVLSVDHRYVTAVQAPKNVGYIIQNPNGALGLCVGHRRGGMVPVRIAEWG